MGAVCTHPLDIYSAEAPLQHGKPSIAAVAVLTVILACALAGCSEQPGGTAASAAPGASTSLHAEPTPDRAGVWGHDIVTVTVRGDAFSHARDVRFELLNTSDPKAQAFTLDACSDGSSWEAVFDPAVSGVGVYRIVARGTGADGSELRDETTYTCTIAFEPTETQIYVGGGDYDVAHGMAGLKVKRIQDVFGNGNDTYPRYLDHTQEAVKDFQKSHGLPATGVVDQETWLALGLDPMEWYTLGTYVSPLAVGSHTSNAERIEAMIDRAYDYLGDPYIWDASGAPGQGVDCAGLVIQGLYAAGYNPSILNPVTHSTTSWGDQDAANLYLYCNLAEVDPHAMQRGDLVFYGKNGTVDHVAIYLGDGQIIEAHPSGVRTARADYRPIMGARRIFG